MISLLSITMAVTCTKSEVAINCYFPFITIAIVITTYLKLGYSELEKLYQQEKWLCFPLSLPALIFLLFSNLVLLPSLSTCFFLALTHLIINVIIITIVTIAIITDIIIVSYHQYYEYIITIWDCLLFLLLPDHIIIIISSSLFFFLMIIIIIIFIWFGKLPYSYINFLEL